MQISVSDAKGRLTDLVRRAEAGDEVILTRRGQPAVRLVPMPSADLVERRRKAIDRYRGAALGRTDLDGVTAANSADFLYEDRGLPA